MFVRVIGLLYLVFLVRTNQHLNWVKLLCPLSDRSAELVFPLLILALHNLVLLDVFLLISA